jgi:capsular exopolysaccharide synthesis family protein
MELGNPRLKPESEALVPAGDLLTRALAAYQLQANPRALSSGEGGPENTIPVAHYLWVLRRYRWHMLSFVVVCTVAAFIVSSRMRPQYQATATLDVDREVPTGVVGDESHQGGAPGDADQFIATQIELIRSDSVLRPVVEKYNLIQVEDSMHMHWRHPAATGIIKPGPGPVGLAYLSVGRPINTYLITISYRSPTPQISADVANAIADSYLLHAYEIRAKSTNTVSKFMEQQLDELRAKREQSQMKLAGFEKELNVINPEQKTNILSQRLLELNTELTAAQADRIKKEAASQSTEGGSLDAATVSGQGDTVKKLADQLNDANQKFALIKQEYGPNHPEYAKEAALVKELQIEFEAAQKAVPRRTNIEYRDAVNRENMLRQTVAEVKAEYDSLNEKSAKYQSLKGEADADNKLYEELVTKIKEASINQGFQNRTVRLADPALPGGGPVSPNIPMNVMMAFLFSTLLAIGGAVLADSLDATLSDPEQVTRELRTNLVGSLPMSRDWKFRFGPVAEGETSTELVRAADSPGTKLLEESIRVLHSSILLSDPDRRIRSILITSISPRDGKSTTSALLATTSAQQGKKTLLIDGDLRRPSMDRFFGVNSPVGLSNVVLGEIPWRKAITPIQRVPNLDLLTSGPPSHRALELAGSSIEDLLEEAVREYSLVIIDSSPLMNFAEPLQMATMVDGVVIVSVAGETTRKAVASVIGRLTRLRVNILGVVLNKVTKHMSENYEYYGYGKYSSTYYYQADRKG